jgi:hypothetical protein
MEDKAWITRLSGTMLSPSTAAWGVEKFMSCLPGIHFMPTATP